MNDQIEIEDPPTNEAEIAEAQPQPLPSTALVAPGEKKIPVLASDRGVMIRSIDELFRFATMIHQSAVAPTFKTPQAIAVAVQTGMEAGMSPMAALNAQYVINGVPSWKGKAALGLVRASGLMTRYRAWIEGEGEKMVAFCESQRKGQELSTNRFTVEDAKIAGLWGKLDYKGKPTPWVLHPRRLMLWRVIGFHLTDNYSDVLLNMPTSEDAMDFGVKETANEPRRSLLPAVAGSAVDNLLASAGVTVIDEASGVPLEVIQASAVTVPDQVSKGTNKTVETSALDPNVTPTTLSMTPVDENRFANLLASMDDSEDFADLERRTYRALTAAGENKAWQGQVKAASKKLLKKFPEPSDNTRG